MPSCSQPPFPRVPVLEGTNDKRVPAGSAGPMYRITCVGRAPRLYCPAAGQADQDRLWGDAATSTWNHRRAAVGSFLVWCTRNAYPAPTLPAGVERQPEQHDETRALDRAAVERLLTRRDIPLREKTLWRMLYETAARADEILADGGLMDQPVWSSIQRLTDGQGGERGGQVEPRSSRLGGGRSVGGCRRGHPAIRRYPVLGEINGCVHAELTRGG